jgi:hypothetical protein
MLQLLARPTGLALRTPLKRALRAAVSRLPEGPSPEEAAEARYTIVCDVTRGEERRRGVLSGRDTYGVTAAMVTRAALTAAARGFSGSGALAPSQAFEPAAFLEGLDRFEIAWQVDAAEQPVPVPA